MFGCLVLFFPIATVSHKYSEEGETVHTWWVQQFCDILGKKGDGWHMILGDNPVGHGFVLRDLVLIELFQLSHNFSQYVIFLSNRRGKFNFQACRETPSTYPYPSSLA